MAKNKKERSVMKVKRTKIKTNSRKAAVAAIALILLAKSNGAILAANVDITPAAKTVIQISDMNLLQNTETEYVEWEDPFTEILDGDVIQYARAGYSSFDWTIKPKTIVQSSATYKENGGSIYVSVKVTPSDTSIRVGIKKNDGMKRYVTGNSRIEHTFEITQEGNYKVFVENTSGTTVYVNGIYR